MDPKDFLDNSQNLDFALNDITKAIWTDRFGRSRKTLWGAEQEFSAQLLDQKQKLDAQMLYQKQKLDAQVLTQEQKLNAQILSQEQRFDIFIQSSGYIVIGEYTDGPLTIDEYNKLIRYNGELWKLNAETTPPYTTTGNDATSWVSDSTHFVSVADAQLRQQISDPYAAEKYPELQIARWRDNFDLRGWGAKRNGVDDDSGSFNAIWEHVKQSLEADTVNMPNVCRTITVPPGEYYINESINWTGLVAWNIYVDMRGAKLIAGPGTGGKAVIDATNVRGLHIEGGYIESTQSGSTVPTCGLLIGPDGTNTCGNNNFRDLKIMGSFSVAPYVNIGSETSYFWNCYFAQTNTDPDTYAAVIDGTYTKLAVRIKSDYTALRASGVPVSFTNNKYYGCHFRHYGGGCSAYLRYSSDFSFDSGCYFLAFNRSNVEAYQSSSQRNVNLSIEGLFETSQGTGVDYVVTFIVPDGASSGIVGFRLITNTPHASISVLRMVNEAGGVTTGTLNIAQVDIRISGRLGSTMLFSQCATMILTGELRCRASAGLNLYDILRFVGIVFTTDGGAISGTPGSKIFNYTLYEETTDGGQVLAVSKGPSSYLGIQNGVRPLLRAEGSAADIDLALQGKGAGTVRFGTLTSNADAPVTGYITIKDASGTLRKLAVIS